MTMMSRQRQLLMAGLQQAEGAVLWGKLRHVQRQGEETPENHQEGGPSRTRKSSR